VLAKLASDQHLVEMDVGVDVRGQQELAGAVDRRGDPRRGVATDSNYPLTVHDDVRRRSVREAGILQSPHGRLR
jgi:hypothetical protein